MRILFFGYREWAFRILEHLLSLKKDWEIVGAISTVNADFDYGILEDVPVEKLGEDKMTTKLMNSGKVFELIQSYNPDYLLFVGWSWMIGERLLNIWPCMCLHISKLPKYRGGSPIQHQIINGEKESATSLFFMTPGLDDGDVLKQTCFSLEGPLSEIFARMSEAGKTTIEEALDGLSKGTLKATPQEESEATVFPRRKKADSMLTIQDLKNWDRERLYNFIRALEDPYPNANIKGENKQILFKKAELSDFMEGVKQDDLKDNLEELYYQIQSNPSITYKNGSLLLKEVVLVENGS